MNSPRVLCELSGVIAIEKPAGLPTQAPAGIPSAESWLSQRLYQERKGGNAAGYLGVPHRLDRAVSGVLLFCNTPRAARKISRQFERRVIQKSYLAIVRGDRADLFQNEDCVEWRDQIEKIPDQPQARIAGPTSALAREAITRVWLRGRLPDQSLSETGQPALFLELQPLTGRMHQLRLQAGCRGIPIVGDLLYGASQPEPYAAALSGEPPADARTLPIALHAWKIAYDDPDSGQRVVIEAPLPASWPAFAHGSCAKLARDLTRQ